MHITTFTKLALLGLLTVSGSLYAKDVFSWKDSRSTVYSDVPNRLRPSQSSVLNVRTKQVSAPAQQQASGVPGLAEQQQNLNNQVAMQNKKIEEENKKIEEQNRQQQEDNCKTAKLNRSFANSARTANKDALIARYDADIAKFCNAAN